MSYTREREREELGRMVLILDSWEDKSVAFGGALGKRCSRAGLGWIDCRPKEH